MKCPVHEVTELANNAPSFARLLGPVFRRNKSCVYPDVIHHRFAPAGEELPHGSRWRRESPIEAYHQKRSLPSFPTFLVSLTDPLQLFPVYGEGLLHEHCFSTVKSFYHVLGMALVSRGDKDRVEVRIGQDFRRGLSPCESEIPTCGFCRYARRASHRLQTDIRCL